MSSQQLNKEVVVALYTPHFCHNDWQYEFDHAQLLTYLETLKSEFAPLGISVKSKVEADQLIPVKGYADLLNVVRIRSATDSIGNLCLGHIIGASESCDLITDIRKGVRRVAFAPETIEPDGPDKVVCHNCGCGC